MNRQLILGWSEEFSGLDVDCLSARVLKQMHFGDEFNPEGNIHNSFNFDEVEIRSDRNGSCSSNSRGEIFTVRCSNYPRQTNVFASKKLFFVPKVIPAVLAYNQAYSKNKLCVEDVVIRFNSRDELERFDETRM